MSFDHPYTCPDIDKNISEAKEVFQDFLQDFLVENNPVLENMSNVGYELRDYLKTQADSLYDAVEFAFEGVRSSNQDMRSSAEYQISELEAIISNLEADNNQLRSQLEE